MSMVNRYIVVWTTRTRKEASINAVKGLEENQMVDMDYYMPFIEGETSEENLEAAKKQFEQLKKRDSTYAATLCKILDSTEAHY